jgi:hypothetical protein
MTLIAVLDVRRHLAWRLITVIAACFAAYACSRDATGTNETEVSSVDLAFVEGSDTISALGGELAVQLIARTRDGRIVRDVTALWSVSSPDVLGVVASHSSGARVAGLRNGSSELRVSVKAKGQTRAVEAKRTVVVRQSASRLVIVSQGYSMFATVPSVIGVFSDAPLQVEARPVDALGSYLSGAVPAVFTVDDSTIVRTSPGGLVLGLRDGITTLRAEAVLQGRVVRGAVDVTLRRPL